MSMIDLSNKQEEDNVWVTEVTGMQKESERFPGKPRPFYSQTMGNDIELNNN